jgi:hypothetical protein
MKKVTGSSRQSVILRFKSQNAIARIKHWKTWEGRMAIPLPTLDLLDSITIPTPCHVPWNEMQGDDRSRLCSQCQTKVFDLSMMTTAAAKSLLTSPGNRPCIRVFRREDGRIMTSDCPVGIRAGIWRHLKRSSAWVASLFAMLFIPACKTAFMGLEPQDYQGVVFPQGLDPDKASNGVGTSQPESK